MSDLYKSSDSFPWRVLSGSLLISGTAIGAGMLGIPLVTAEAGVIPGFFVTTLVWLFMFFSGMLMLEATLWLPDGANFLSISEAFLGKTGRAITGAFFCFLYYCLMIAYMAAGSLLLHVVLRYASISIDPSVSLILFASIFFVIVGIGPKTIDRANMVMSVGMVATWLLLLGAGVGEVRMEYIEHIEWKQWYWALPVLFSAFGYHNIIPSLATYLHRDKKALRMALFFGTLIPYVTYVLWQVITIGILPLSAIQATLQKGAPITNALAEFTGNPWVVSFGQFFALFAIITSVLGVSFSMVDFFGDGLRWKRSGSSRWALCAITFIPPTVIAFISPHLFDVALGIAGGIGESFLNGLLPIGLVFVGRYRFHKSPIVGSLGSLRTLLFGAIAASSVFMVEIVDLLLRLFR